MAPAKKKSSGGGASTLIRVAIFGGIVVLFGWILPERGIIDYQQDLWSKPGRAWAVIAALGVALLVAAVMARAGGVKTVPLLLIIAVVGAGAYFGGLYGHTMGRDLPCKRGYAVSLDGVCAKATAK